LGLKDAPVKYAFSTCIKSWGRGSDIGPTDSAQAIYQGCHYINPLSIVSLKGFVGYTILLGIYFSGIRIKEAQQILNNAGCLHQQSLGFASLFRNQQTGHNQIKRIQIEKMFLVSNHGSFRFCEGYALNTPDMRFTKICNIVTTFPRCWLCFSHQTRGCVLALTKHMQLNE
jgi:hypothetical protein